MIGPLRQRPIVPDASSQRPNSDPQRTSPRMEDHAKAGSERVLQIEIMPLSASTRLCDLIDVTRIGPATPA